MKRPLTIAAVVSLFLLLPLVGGAGLIWWQRGEAAKKWPTLDDEPPLVLKAPPLPEDEQAWSLVLEALEHYDADNDGAQEQLSAIGLPVNASLWAHQQVSLERIKQAMDRPSLRTPYRKHLEDDFPSLLPLMQVGRNQVLRGWESAESGLLTEAVDDMLLTDALGTRLIDGSEDLIIVMIGVALTEIALEELEELIVLLPPEEPGVLVHALAGLKSGYPRSTAAAARGVARDCTMFETTYREFGDHPERLLTESSMDGETTPYPIQSRIAALRYDADATIAQHRKVCRAAVSRMEAPPYDRASDYAPPIQPSGVYNDIGSVLLSVGSPDYTRFVDQERSAVVRRSGLMVLTAARLYALNTGAQPATLDALVPDYLDAVPVDGFTGQPMALTGTTLTTGAEDGDVPLSWELLPLSR
ncbi:MAG: hypothetical protein ACI8RZ_005486 [Myxococcota bacterium]|jgi:hypothetical protein